MTLEEKIDYLIKRIDQLILLQGPMSNHDRTELKKSLVEEIVGKSPPQKVHEITIFRDLWSFMIKIVRKFDGIIF